MKVRYILLCSYILFVTGFVLPTPARSQQSNPFELKPRLKAMPDTMQQPGAAHTSNPFDIVAPPTQTPAIELPAVRGAAKRGKQASTTEEEAREADGVFLFGVIVAMLLVLALLITLLRPVIAKVYRAFFNDNLLNQLHREQGAVVRFPYQLLYLMFFLNAGIFVFLLLRWLDIKFFTTNWWLLLFSTGIVAAVFLFKHLLLAILAWLFPIDKELRTYSFTIVVFNIITGIVLVPFNIFIAYGPVEMVKGAIYGAIGLLIVIYLFRQLRGLFLAGRYISFHKLHFLLYLCAVEVSPVLVFIKLILLNSGV